MGTRGAFGFWKDGVHKVTYNHSDSYPSVLGNEVVEFIKGHTIGELNKIFDKIEMVDRNTKPTKEQIEKCKPFTDLGVSSQSTNDWYCLLREAQGNLSAYADWAYIINLSDNVLEVYRGFQKSKPMGRYANIKPIEDFYAVGLLAEIPLDDCPEDISSIEYLNDINLKTSNWEKIKTLLCALKTSQDNDWDTDAIQAFADEFMEMEDLQCT
jgi:hypothetical protein